MRFNPPERARQASEIERVIEYRAIVVMISVPTRRPVETIRVAGADS